jgi:hypothetical protein
VIYSEYMSQKYLPKYELVAPLMCVKIISHISSK